MISSVFDILSNKTARLILGGLLLLLILGGFFACLTYQKNQAEKEAREAKEETNRLQRETEGQKILINTANIAVGVENEKKSANQQQANSKLANNNYVNTRRRDSNQSSNSLTDAKRRFCQEFPDDSKCR